MAASKNPVLRYGLFIALLLLLVGGFAWVTQYIPRWRGQKTQPDPVAIKSREVLQFSRPKDENGQELIGDLRALWTADGTRADKDYAEETEQNRESHYYFPFRNVLQAPAELGVETVGVCDCTNLAVGLLPRELWGPIEADWMKMPWAEPPFSEEPQWQPFEKNDRVGVKIPADTYGLLRVTWKARKNPGDMLTLHLRIWSEPEGQPTVRQVTPVYIPVRVVPAVMFDPMLGTVGVLGSGQTARVEFNVWSATRDKLDISFQPREAADPLYKIESRLLTAAERARFHDEIRKNPKKRLDSRVRCGYRVTVTLHEQKDGQQMDQGPFSRPLPVTLDQLPVESGTPAIQGVVRGIVEVGGEVDQGKVQFKTFSAADPKSVVVPLYADPQVKLTVDHREPACLQVDLKPNPKESTKQRAQWDLKVTIAAGAWKGPLPESSRVVLRIAGDPPRLVRIPVTGTGTR